MRMQGFEAWVLRSGAWDAFSRGVVVPWVADFARFREDAEVLEIGCGQGSVALALAERFPGWSLTATDVDPDMVVPAIGRLARFGDRVKVEVADAEELPYPVGRFDVVVAVLVWHHVDVWRAATREAFRVLRPGGSLVLADVRHPRSSEPKRGLLAGTYGLEALHHALADAGFREWRVSEGRVSFRLEAR
ncbi:MAG: class I SAM-dependent methyltransferase [Actinobacteria bacterium]|nr:class I SAM-dependent methyltransferase [Actinomycetota bacterium]